MKRTLPTKGCAGAYRSIIELFDEYNVPTTFASADLFAESEDSFHELIPRIGRWPNGHRTISVRR